MSTIIERKQHLKKEKTPSNNYEHFLQIAEDLKTVKKSAPQNVLAKQISEKFTRLNSFDGKPVQVRQ